MLLLFRFLMHSVALSMVTPLLINFSTLGDATSRPPLTAMHPDVASSRHNSGVKARSKRILVQ